LPKKVTLLNRHGVPFYSVIAISLGIAIGIVLNVVLPMFFKDASQIFVMVYSSSVLPGMVPWFVILISEIEFRKQHPEEMVDHPFKMPFAPYSNYVTLVFLAITLIFMFLNPETRISILVGVVFLAIMTVRYFRKYHKKETVSE